MTNKLVIGLRYCGGCNPRYDRVEAAERLRAKLPESVELRPAAPGQRAVLVVCGCSARCANVSGLDGKLVWLCALEELDMSAAALQRIICE